MFRPPWSPRACAGIAIASAILAAAPAAAQASAVNLGTAGSFVVLGGSAVTNTGPSVLNGDLGIAPGTALVGFGSPAVVNGVTHDNDAVATQGQSDLTTAYDSAAAQPVSADLTGQDLGGLTLTAGAYRFSSSAQLTGNVTLDAAGDPAAQFVFMIGSTLTTASDSRVTLINGASPCNVFWQVGTSATLGTTTAFQGTLMAKASVTLNHAATVQGRALARTGAVTLDDNVLDRPACTTTGSTPPGTGPGSGGGGPAGSGGSPTPGSPTGADGTPVRAPTTAGAARLYLRTAHTPGAIGALGPPASEAPRSSCLHGFLATVKGHLIARVVFLLNGRRIATRTGYALHVLVRAPAGRRMALTARVSFKDSTRARTLHFAYRSCAAAVLRPARGPSRFTG